MMFASRPREAYRVFDEDEFLGAGELESSAAPDRAPQRAERASRAARARALRVAVVVLVAGIGGAALGLIAVGTMRGVGAAALRTDGVRSVVAAHAPAASVIGGGGTAAAVRSRGVAPRRRGKGVTQSSRRMPHGVRDASREWSRTKPERALRAPTADGRDATSAPGRRGAGEFGFER